MRRFLFPLFCAALAGCSPPSESDTASDPIISRAPLPPIQPFGPTPQWNAAWNNFDLGQGLASKTYQTPAVVSTPRGLELFQIAIDGHLYHRIGDGTTWGAPEDLGSGFRNEKPAAASNGHQLVVAAVRVSDNSVQTRTFIFSETQWQPWVAAGGTTYAPVAMTAGAWYFYIAAIGTEGHLWYNYSLLPYLDGSWFGWADIGGTCDKNIAPAAASWGGNRVDFLVARDGDRQAFHTSLNDLVQGSWDDLGATMTFGALSSWGANHLDFFIRTPGAQLLQRTYDNGWADWHQLLSCEGGAPPVATSSQSGRIDLFTTGTDISFWHTFYGSNATSAPGPQPYCCGMHGAACCPKSVSSSRCLDGYRDACDPISNTCQTCGNAVGQGCCRQDWNSTPICNEGKNPAVECNLNTNKCEADSSCGTAGHVCCYTNNCTDGSTCQGAVQGLSFGMCVAPSCSATNAACGAGKPGCCSGLACLSGKCTAASATTCGGHAATGSAQWFTLAVRYLSLCAEGVQTVFANSQSEAIGCGQRLYPGYYVDIATSGYQDYEWALWGLAGCTQITTPAFSETDARNCAQYSCINCTVATGQCP